MSHVLVVDGNDSVRQLLAGLLRSAGHKVEAAANGLQALSLLSNKRFDAVLMDTHLPVMDGVEACRRLRAFSQVPVLLLATFQSPDIHRLALSCGANAFLPKPSHPDRLLSWLGTVNHKSPLKNGSPTGNAESKSGLAHRIPRSYQMAYALAATQATRTIGETPAA